MFDLLYKNLTESRSDIQILASHTVAGRGDERHVLKRTPEPRIVSPVLSGQDLSPDVPATTWLANFRRRSATKGRFLQMYQPCELANESSATIAGFTQYSQGLPGRHRFHAEQSHQNKTVI